LIAVFPRRYKMIVEWNTHIFSPDTAKARDFEVAGVG
jgi:hypothetical protein